MADVATNPTGEGEIETTFTMTGRGWVLMLNSDFHGTIPANGIVESDRGSAPYIGPELGERKRNGTTTGVIGVLVDSKFKEYFERGQWVRFYKRPELSGPSSPSSPP
jgi:hypothetical protein